MPKIGDIFSYGSILIWETPSRVVSLTITMLSVLADQTSHRFVTTVVEPAKPERHLRLVS